MMKAPSKVLNLFRTPSGLFVPPGSAAATPAAVDVPAENANSTKALNKASKPVVRKERRLIWALPPGHDWNPLRNFPRNSQCFCGSGQKAKKCCLPNLAQCISKKNAQKVRNCWNQLVSSKMTLKDAILQECPIETRGLSRRFRIRESLRAARLEAEAEAVKTAHAPAGDPKE